MHILLVKNTNDVNLKPVQIFPRESLAFESPFLLFINVLLVGSCIYIYSMRTAKYNVYIYIYIFNIPSIGFVLWTTGFMMSTFRIDWQTEVKLLHF